MVQRIPTSGPPSHNLSFSTVLSGRMQNIYNKICGYHDLNIVTMYALENHNKRYPTFLNYSSLLKYKEANPKVWIQISQKAYLKLLWMSARCLLWLLLWRSHTLCKGSTSYKIKYLSISFSMVCQSSLLSTHDSCSSCWMQGVAKSAYFPHGIGLLLPWVDSPPPPPPPPRWVKGLKYCINYIWMKCL